MKIVKEIANNGLALPFFKNSKGTKDALLTIALFFALIGWACFGFGGSSFEVHSEIVNFSVKLRELDEAGVAALLTTLSAYIVRRHGIGSKKKEDTGSDNAG